MEHSVTVAKHEEQYDAMLRLTLEKFPDIVLVLCEPFIFKVGNIGRNWKAYHADMTERKAVVRQLADQYNTVFVGFQEVFNNACKNAPADYWIWDGIHPILAGHELLAREWIKQVGKKISFQ